MTNLVTCVDVFGKEHKVSAAELSWRPSVYGIVIHDDKVLLSKQFGNRYDLPGGGVDINESLDEAVIREVKEETGIDVSYPKVIAVDDNYFQSSHAENKSYHSVLVYYVCSYVGGDLSTEGFDENEKEYAEIAEWIPLNNLDDIEIASTVDFRKHIRKADSI